MSKLLPILAIIVFVVIAIVAGPTIYSNLTKPAEIKGVQAQKTVLTIADSNIAVTQNGTTQEATPQDASLPRLYATDFKINVPFAAMLAYELATSDFQVSNIRILDSETVSVYNPEDTVVIFTVKKDAKVQIDSLQKTLALAKMNATKIAKIDLRFDKPTITLK